MNDINACIDASSIDIKIGPLRIGLAPRSTYIHVPTQELADALRAMFDASDDIERIGDQVRRLRCNGVFVSVLPREGGEG